MNETMTVIPIKPLSVNAAFQGRRFRTKKYDQYEHDLLFLLPKTAKKYGKEPLRITFEFGISALQDLDGCLKQTLDILCKKYSFNDRYVMEIKAGKTIVKKSKEFLAFRIETI